MARTTVLIGSLLLIIALGAYAAPPVRDCWDRICDDLTDLGETVNELMDHAARPVAKAARKADHALEGADSTADTEDAPAWFRVAPKLAKRVEQLVRRVRRVNQPAAAESLNEGLRAVYRSSQGLLSARADDVRGRPGYGAQNRLQRAVAAAEAAIDRAEALIEAGKPVRKALKKLQKGVRKMDRLSR